VVPLPRDLLAQGDSLIFVEFLDAFESSRVLGDQSTLPQEREDVFGQALFPLEGGDVVEQFLAGEVLKGVLDFTLGGFGELGGIFFGETNLLSATIRGS
jgi:hypothetical protein